MSQTQLYRFSSTYNISNLRNHRAHLLSFGGCKVIWSVLMLLCVCLLSNTHCETVLIDGQLPHMCTLYTVMLVCVCVCILYTQYLIPLAYTVYVLG